MMNWLRATLMRIGNNCYNEEGKDKDLNFFYIKVLSEPEFFGDLVCKFKKIMGRTDISDQFRKLIMYSVKK